MYKILCPIHNLLIYFPMLANCKRYNNCNVPLGENDYLSTNIEYTNLEVVPPVNLQQNITNEKNNQIQTKIRFTHLQMEDETWSPNKKRTEVEEESDSDEDPLHVSSDKNETRRTNEKETEIVNEQPS
ncbi:hypothetical protein FQR65_LT16597 [Abscondita terminalis]|nr:hypothetical protein FQR65_LT16597 [Abscondita terminalis]